MIIVHYLPVYWGVETNPPDRSLVTRSTLHETLPPFRKSTWAVRIRVSHRHWLHMGRFGYQRDIGRWGMSASPGEIAAWGRKPYDAEKEAEDDSALLAVRPLRPGRPDRPAGGDDDAQRRTVPWVEPQRNGSDLGAEPA